MKIIYLTNAEYRELKMIVINGWADGDILGYGGSNKKIQNRAFDKVQKPFNNITELKNTIGLTKHLKAKK